MGFILKKFLKTYRLLAGSVHDAFPFPYNADGANPLFPADSTVHLTYHLSKA